MHNRPFTRRWRKRLNRQQESPAARSRASGHHLSGKPAGQPEKQEILEAVRDHQVVIVAGKPARENHPAAKNLYGAGARVKGLIGHTQPRRLAARTVANRIAEELQTEPGGCIGYKVRLATTSAITPWSS
jgi:HrpA-like RNA helicase